MYLFYLALHYLYLALFERIRGAFLRRCKLTFTLTLTFTFNLYRLVNFNSLAKILAVVTDNTIYSKVS